MCPVYSIKCTAPSSGLAAAVERSVHARRLLCRRDVFRFPPQRNLFCAFVGTGTQLLGLAIAIFGLACMNLFYPYNRWALALARGLPAK
jgi:Endomembrane protein 70